MILIQSSRACPHHFWGSLGCDCFPPPRSSSTLSHWKYKWPDFIFWRKEGMSELHRLLGWFLGVGEKDEECLSPDFTEGPRIRETRSCFMGAFLLFGVFLKSQTERETRSKWERWKVDQRRAKPKERGGACPISSPHPATPQSPSWAPAAQTGMCRARKGCQGHAQAAFSYTSFLFFGSGGNHYARTKQWVISPILHSNSQYPRYFNAMTGYEKKYLFQWRESVLHNRGEHQCNIDAGWGGDDRKGSWKRRKLL